MIVVPHFQHVNIIAQFLKPADVIIVIRVGKNLGQIVKGNSKQRIEKSIVYKIPCNDCNKPYYGETGRSLDVRLKEHIKDIQYQRDKTIVKHSQKCGALPKWEDARRVKENINKRGSLLKQLC